jgi:hypothetical protein
MEEIFGLDLFMFFALIMFVLNGGDCPRYHSPWWMIIVLVLLSKTFWGMVGRVCDIVVNVWEVLKK